jgi:hypothetical protein
MSEIQQSQAQNTTQSKLQQGTAPATAEAPLTAEQAVAELRALKARLPNVDPLTDQERKQAREQARLALSAEAMQASINTIGAADAVAQAAGVPPEDARQFVDETAHWTAVEAELKSLFTGVSDANLLRRQRLGILASKVYGIAREVARDNPSVRIHVKEIKRLRSLARGRKRQAAAPAPEAPAQAQTPQATATASEPSSDTSTKTK